MNATTRQMLTFVPGVPNLPIMTGCGASPRETMSSHARGGVFNGAFAGMPGAPAIGGPMGAPQMGAPAAMNAGPPMNVQPGAPMMNGNMPFGASPNTTMTTMNSSTMSTTAP